MTVGDGFDLARFSDLTPEQLELLRLRLARGNRSEGRRLQRVERLPRDRTAFELSFAQQRLWFLDQLAGGRTSYAVATAASLEGRLDVRAVWTSLAALVHRHETLRTTFSLQAGRPVQSIRPWLSPALRLVDLSRFPAAPAEAAGGALLEAESRRPFDLAKGPLLRVTLVRTAPQQHLLALVLHHLVADGWSVTLLLRELVEGYVAALGGERPVRTEPPVQYVDFADWQRRRLSGELLERELAFWKENLEGSPPLLDLPTDRPHPEVASGEGASCQLSVPPEVWEQAQGLAREREITPFVVLLGAFNALLERLSAEEDLVVGSAIAGRSRPELKEVVGPFVNALVLRTCMSGDPTFKEVLDRVHRVVLDAHAHQDLPFERIVEVVAPERNLAHAPIFQVAFLLQNFPMPSLDLPALRLEMLRLDTGVSRFDLGFVLSEERGRLTGEIQFRTDLFDAATAAALAEAYPRLLARLVEAPELRLSNLELGEPLAQRAHEARRRRSSYLAVASTFTAEPLGEVLELWNDELGLDLRIRFSPYGQVFQELLDPQGTFATNRDGGNVVLLRFEDWLRDVAPDGDGAADGGNGEPRLPARERLERNLEDLLRALRAAAGRSAVPLLVVLCPASPGALTAPGAAELFAQLEAGLAGGIAETAGVHLVLPDELASAYPVPEAHDPRADEIGHVPYSEDMFAALGTQVVRRLEAVRRPPRKVVVLDCDNTLWQGVVGEDGPLGVVVDPPRRALQERLVELSREGLLLCLCSKNLEDDVLEVLDRHPRMVLRREHLVAWRIGWGTKSEGLRGLAEELDLGLDSFVFLDDNPVECAEVRGRLPEVLTLHLPTAGDGPGRFLDHVWALDRPTVTAEDRRRLQLYRERAERHRFESEALSFEEFLAGLDLQVSIAPLAARQCEEVARVSQLTLRTNQFNTTAVRRSEAEVRALPESGAGEWLVVRVRDRFGEYGLVGAILCTGADALRVEALLLSCRVLGRGVEHHVLRHLGGLARERGLGVVEIVLRENRRNRPAADFLRSLGGSWSHWEDGAGVVRIPAEEAERVRFRPAAAPTPEADPTPSPSGTATSAPANGGSKLGQRLATDLAGVAPVLRAVRSRRGRRRGAPAAPFVAPRTPIEEVIADLWKELLGLDRVGVHDDFFRAGGHSLLGTLLLARIARDLDVEIGLVTLFERPTVAGLAEAVEEALLSDVSRESLAELAGLSEAEILGGLSRERDALLGGAITEEGEGR